jgi:hypothetical protein
MIAPIALILVLMIGSPVWAKGHGGGHGASGAHGCVSHGHATRGAGSGAIASAAAERRRLHVGGSLTSTERGFATGEDVTGAEGQPDSDLGPWIIFLWMGRAAVGAARSLAAL